MNITVYNFDNGNSQAFCATPAGGDHWATPGTATHRRVLLRCLMHSLRTGHRLTSVVQWPRDKRAENA